MHVDVDTTLVPYHIKDQENGQSLVGVSKFDAWYFGKQLIQGLVESGNIIYV